MPEVIEVSIATRYGDVEAEEKLLDGSSPTSRSLLFLHGGAANLRSWDGVIRHLNHRCLAIDLPGHGKTTIDPMPFDQLDDLLRDVVQSMADRKPVVIGHSFGGLAAVAAGALSGDLYGGVIAVDPPMSNAEIRYHHDTLDSALQELRDMEWPWPGVSDLDTEVERVVASMAPREDMAQVREMVRRGYRKQNDGIYIRFPRREDEIKGVQANWSIDVDDAYGSVSCPLAIALAGADGVHRFRNHDIDTRRKLTESLSQDRPVEFQVFDCGHDIPGYQSCELALFISQWLSGLDA
jgi:pimeloyl-ACP methyl ester carboxylesterase|tara:strand:+ start:5799 stop:6680 length:882 start_codon:yes stop_codon:yes gene_type:complete